MFQRCSKEAILEYNYEFVDFFKIIFDSFNLLNVILIDYSVDYFVDSVVILIDSCFAPTFALGIYFMLASSSF